MKHTIIFIAFIVLTIQANEFNIKVNNYDPVEVDRTLISLMEDLKYFAEKPLNWCDVIPTGEFEIMRQQTNTSRVRMRFEVTCDERQARSKFKQFWMTYNKFLYNHGDRVDQAIECMYPDYSLKWGFMVNDHDFIKWGIHKSNGGTGSFHDKTLFFRLNINGDHLTGPMRFNMPGSTLKLIATTTIPERFSHKAWFVFNVPTKLLKNGEFDVEIKRQWHLVQNESFIKKSNLY